MIFVKNCVVIEVIWFVFGEFNELGGGRIGFGGFVFNWGNFFFVFEN